jgi:hypothetical protein
MSYFEQSERMKILIMSLHKKVEELDLSLAESNKKLEFFEKTENQSGFKIEVLSQKKNRYKEIALMGLQELDSIKIREVELIEIIKELRNRILIKQLERNEIMTKETMDIFKGAECEYINSLRETLANDYVYLKHQIVEDFRKHEILLQGEQIDVVYQRFSLEKYFDL